MELIKRWEIFAPLTIIGTFFFLRIFGTKQDFMTREEVQRVSTKEIISDYETLPVDIKEVVWVMANEHDLVVEKIEVKLKIAIEALTRITGYSMGDIFERANEALAKIEDK